MLTKTLTRHGNSSALVIDKPILEMLGIDDETQLQITTDGSNIIVSPIGKRGNRAKNLSRAIERLHANHHQVLKRLAE